MQSEFEGSAQSENWPEGMMPLQELLKAIAYKQPKVRRWVPLKLMLAGLLMVASLGVLVAATLIAFGHASSPVRAAGLLSLAAMLFAYVLIQMVDLYEVIRHGSV